jgi:anti-anti-sigma factor
MIIATDKKTLIFRFDEEMNSKAVEEVHDEIMEQIEVHDPNSIIFDMNKVKLISSAFIRLCIASIKEVKFHNLKIINASPFVKRIFNVAGLDKVFTII